MSTADAFAVSADMLRADDAVERLVAMAAPVAGTDTLPLLDAVDRVLAEDVTAGRANPPHNNSAVDGYAVRFADLHSGAASRLPLSQRITAGMAPGPELAAGTAARIFTGAPTPAGADTVIAQELCGEVDGTHVDLPAVKKPGANLRRAGEDFAAGAVVLRAGLRLRPQEVGMAAAVGRDRLTVRQRPRVGVFSTGDEILEPGQPPRDGAIYDINRYTVMAMVAKLGCQAVDLGILADRRDTVTAALAAAAGRHDLLLTSGGVSTGDEDHVRGAVESLGRMDFWRVAIRPGRPLAFGRVGTTPFLGLPGNPVASMVCFMVFARPLLLRLAGRDRWSLPVRQAAAGFEFKKKPGRREWLRGWLDGETVQRFPNEGSGILSSMTAATGLIDLPEDLDLIRPGDPVRFVPFAELWA